MSDVVDWALAERIAVRAVRGEPFAGSYHYDALGPDFAELTALAEELVTAETGLRSLEGPATAVVTDRAGWVSANISSFQRLLSPMLDSVGDRIQGPAGAVMRRASALEIGLLLGWMSSRVLGQYDLLMVGDEAVAGDDPAPGGASGDQGDVVYYVGPNVLSIEKRFGFPPREFRLWLALHEVTHRAQFTGVPWMREHYHSLVQKGLGGVSMDPNQLFDVVRRVMSDMRSGKSPLADGGIAALIASPAQRDALDRIGGLMSLLEGHGDITMDRAGKDHVPSAPRFSRALKARRQQAGSAQRFLQRLLGFEAKLNQYAQGERFIEAVEELGGPDALDPVWRGPSWLPTLEEIRTPEEWLARVRLSDELVR